jgi:hypothetical protein
MAQTIKCPKCGSEIPLDAAISQRIREEMQAEFEQARQGREQEFARRDSALAAREKQVQDSLRSVDDAVAEKLTLERGKIETEAKQKAADAARLELADLKNQVAERAKELAVAQEKELALRQQQRQLESEKQSLELNVARRLDEERQKVREEAVKKAAEEHLLKDKEKDKIISDMKAQLDEARRRAEQGSQQTQGEVLELDLEEQLRVAFPLDGIEPVPKGTKGADVIQRVSDRSGRPCGTIVWEAKRTKGWRGIRDSHLLWSDVKARFRTEFINRVDEQIVFRPLSEEDERRGRRNEE